MAFSDARAFHTGVGRDGQTWVIVDGMHHEEDGSTHRHGLTYNLRSHQRSQPVRIHTGLGKQLEG